MRLPATRRSGGHRSLAATIALAVLCAGCTRPEPRLNGGGSTFIGPLMKKWAIVYNEKTGVEVDYALKGSGNGIQQMIARTYDFGCTDAPLNKDELTDAKRKGGEVLHIPLVIGAVVPVYNLPELKDVGEPVRFTGPVLAKIFLGQITTWNDPEIARLNPALRLPGRAIVVVRRADPSGTTYIWTDYLATVSELWQSKVGPGAKEVTWWTGAVGEQGNQGVAQHVSAVPGSIGYVELEYAVKNELRCGAVQNRDKNFMLATAESVTAAVQGAESDIPADLCFTLNNKPGANAYPVCGAVWAVLYKDQPADTGKVLVDYLTWVTHDGQRYARELNYAPLSEGLVRKIEGKLKLVKFVE
jgi:phosphate ABC transporter phosphate-binding protein